jgi:hypothetical protein
MSFNLTLNSGKDGPEIPLSQTPTWITFICLSYNPRTNQPDGGHKAVRKRYIMWLKSSLQNGSWDPEDLELQKEIIDDQIKLINSVKNPYFSYI